MNTILIGYDLNRQGQRYGELIEKIKELGSTWWHCLDSTWIVKTPLDQVQVRDALLPLMDSNDEVLVVNITGDAAAWAGLNQECSEWLRTNL